MHYLKNLAILMLLALSFSSCEKETVLEQDHSQISQNDEPANMATSIESSDYFDVQFLFKSLGLKSNNNGYVSGVDQIIKYYKSDDSVLRQLERQGIWPCWYCTETDHYEALNYYTPLYNRNSSDFEGLLFTRKEDGKLFTQLVTSNLAAAMAASSREELPKYINQVMEYFRGTVNGKIIKDYAGSRQEPCVISEATGRCVCQTSGADCTDYSQDQAGGPKCLDYCDGDGGSGGPAVGEQDPYSNEDQSDYGGPGTCFFCGIIGGGDSGSTDGPGGNGPESEFDITERQNMVATIVEYVEENTNINLTYGNILALSNELHFDYTTYQLFLNLTILTEAQIEAYIQLITDHRHFILDELTTNILLFNADLCSAMNTFLTTNNGSEDSYRYGRVVTKISTLTPWTGLIPNAQLLMNLELATPGLKFSDAEIEHILTFEPALISDIGDFLSDYLINPVTVQIVHDFIDLQYCNTIDPCVHTNYANDFAVIFQFYNSMSSSGLNWLSLIENFLEQHNVDMPFYEFLNLFQNGCNSCSANNFNKEASDLLLAYILENEGITTDNISTLINLLNLDSEFGLTTSEIDNIKNNFDISTSKVPISKLDWSKIKAQTKITQIYYWLATIDYVYNKFDMNPDVNYSLADFFTNVSGTASIDLIANIKLSVLGAERRVKGEQFEVFGSKLVINEILSPKTFSWAGNVLESGSSDNVHFYFPKTGSSEWGFSILNFIIPDQEWSKFQYN